MADPSGIRRAVDVGDGRAVVADADTDRVQGRKLLAERCAGCHNRISSSSPTAAMVRPSPLIATSSARPTQPGSGPSRSWWGRQGVDMGDLAGSSCSGSEPLEPVGRADRMAREALRLGRRCRRTRRRSSSRRTAGRSPTGRTGLLAAWAATPPVPQLPLPHDAVGRRRRPARRRPRRRGPPVPPSAPPPRRRERPARRRALGFGRLGQTLARLRDRLGPAGFGLL